MGKMSSDLKNIVRDVLAEEAKEEDSLNDITKMLEELNKKVDALAAK